MAIELIWSDGLWGKLSHVLALASEPSITSGTSGLSELPQTQPSVLSPETIAILEAVGQVIRTVVGYLSPYLVPFCVVLAWLLVFATVANAIAGIRAAAHRVRVAHSIPCSRCVFFTNDHRLKCPVDPVAAASEAAIGCPHYEEHRGAYTSQLQEIDRPVS